MENPPLESMFKSSWLLLRANRVIIVPGMAAGLMGGLAQALLAPTMLVVGSFTWAIASIIGLFVSVASLTYTTGMAEVAWERGVARLNDGKCAFAQDASRVMLAGILLSVLATVAMILALPTLGVSLLGFAFFSVYTIAAVVVGRKAPLPAFAESATIAMKRPVPTAAILVSFILVFVSASVIGWLLSFIPLAGPVLAALIVQTCASYFVVVIVGEYLTACGTPPQLRIPESKPEPPASTGG